MQEQAAPGPRQRWCAWVALGTAEAAAAQPPYQAAAALHHARGRRAGPGAHRPRCPDAAAHNNAPAAVAAAAAAAAGKRLRERKAERKEGTTCCCRCCLPGFAGSGLWRGHNRCLNELTGSCGTWVGGPHAHLGRGRPSAHGGNELEQLCLQGILS
eukprot:1021941-Pelagomonas_calceolata.AAC.13